MRTYVPFRAVNRHDLPGFDPGLQRHHLLPRQLLSEAAFAPLLGSIGGRRRRFEDFRENGLLLPCCEPSALRLALPMHRGPHRRYSELVTERMGQIEAGWSRLRRQDPMGADQQARMRMRLLQQGLRRYLLQRRQARPLLSRLDPVGQGEGFVELDALADALWSETSPIFISVTRPEGQAMPVRRSSSSRAD